jgi:hypothetical protein
MMGLSRGRINQKLPSASDLNGIRKADPDGYIRVCDWWGNTWWDDYFFTGEGVEESLYPGC